MTSDFLTGLIIGLIATLIVEHVVLPEVARRWGRG